MKVLWQFIKVLPCPSPPDMSSPLLKALKWGTVWSFTSRGKKVKRFQSQKFQKRPILLSKFVKPKVCLFAILMPLKIKLHTVPHFKALNSSEDIFGGGGQSRTFKVIYVLSKYPQFIS